MPGANEKGVRFPPDPGGGPLGPAGKNHLLVIAIDEYHFCPRLSNCVKDAREFIEVLKEKYEFEAANILTLYNTEATRPNIHTRFKELRNRVGAQDNLVIYFSGHGETEGNTGYWVPVEAHPEREWEFFSTDEIRQRLNDIDSFHTFVIADACFSGSLFSAYKAVKAGYETKRSRLGLAASHSRERALDGRVGENSPFAGQLLKKLRENAGNLGVQKLATEVIEEVQAATQGRQTPVFKTLDVKGDDSGQYVFRMKADEAADWASCRQTGTLAAYQAFLARYPQGRFAGEAREQLGFLQDEEAWKTARTQNTVDAYLQYRRQNPQGQYRQQALELIEELEEEQSWLQARRRNTIFSYEQYLDQYPHGRHKKEAADAIQRLIPKEAAGQRQQRQQEAPPPVTAPKPKVEPEFTSAALGNAASLPILAKKRTRYFVLGGALLVILLAIWGLWPKGSAVEEKTSLEVFETDGVYGYRDGAGNMVIPVQYEKAGPFENGRAQVVLKGLSFTIDESGACVADCPEEQEKAAWIEAEQLNTVETYHKYQQRFPEGQFFAEAQKKIEQLKAEQENVENVLSDQEAWQAAAKKDDLPAYKQYMQAFPSGQYYEQAKGRVEILMRQQRQEDAARKEDQAWERAKIENTVSSYQAYQKLYPKGKYFAWASELIKKLDQETFKPETAKKQKTTTTNTVGTVALGGKTYRTLRLNGLSWMAQNLDYEVPDSWCYDNNPANCRKYGRLYTWEAAKKACAAVGWRLPTDQEWRDMAKLFGGVDDDASDGGAAAYKALMEGGGSGFSVLLGGWRSIDGSFYNLGDHGYYWSATEYGADSARYYYFNRDNGELYLNYGFSKAVGRSCRCVRD